MRRSSDRVKRKPVIVRKMSIPPEMRPLAKRWKHTTNAKATPRTPCNSGRKAVLARKSPTMYCPHYRMRVNRFEHRKPKGAHNYSPAHDNLSTFVTVSLRVT